VPIGLEIVSKNVVSHLAPSTENFTGSESEGTTFRRSYGFQNFASHSLLSPADWILDLIGIGSVIGLDKVADSYVNFNYTLRVTGDPGARAMVQASASVNGYYNHQIEALPHGDARSVVDMYARVTHASGERLINSSARTEKKHNDDRFHSDLEIKSLSPNSVTGTALEAVVGDIIAVDATFLVYSEARINQYCGILGCVSGIGPFVLTQTVGSGSVRVTATAKDPPPLVPLPPAGALLAGAFSVLALRRAAARAT
jgi:hypothetical protein